ncbi:MAG: hypothetical protein SGJ19_12570 [Planctomycetia bacterium]|nr:hypothetical protein [Planctomycetia bacterium]
MPLLLLAAAAVGVDTGWTPLDSGGYEFIIQIPPEQLDALRAGGEVGSDLPNDTGAIRSYKIVIGTGPLANQGVDLPPEARISFKQPVNDAASSRRIEGSILRLPPPPSGRNDGAVNDTAKAVQGTRPPSTDGWQLPERSSNNKNNAKTQAEIGEEPLEDIDFIGKTRATRAKSAGLPAPPMDNDVTPVDTKKLSTEEDEVGPSARKDGQLANANEPETWTKSKFMWTLMLLGLIVSGGLNGYFIWLSLDFRNRYLELLRDLDTQPADEPAESSREYERTDDHEEPEEEEVSPRELVRTAETYVGRKEGQRRRDRESSRYDDDDE